MSFPRYAAYKDSGIEWLGEVPQGWEVRKISHFFKAQKGNEAAQLTKEFCATIDGDYPVYSGQTENNGVMARINRYEFDSGDNGFLFSTTVGAKAMSVMHLTGKFSLSQNCMIIIPKKPKEYVRFFYYHFQPLFQYERGLIPEHMQASFRMEDLYQYKIMIPPIQEQTTIAAFLDCETAKIDNLINEQKKLIELLKEKRQAVISTAVSKGLNPHAPMKDSGVEWLGEVPIGWEVKLLRFFADVLRGKFTHRPRNDPAFYDGDFPFIQTGDITGSDKFIIGYKQTLNEKGIAVSKEFPKGTLVMAIAANIGDVAILDFAAYFPDSIVGLVPNQDSNLFFMYYLMIAMKQPMIQTATVSTQMNLSVDQITALKAACPPLIEQQKIVAFLDHETAKIDTLITKAESAIQLLQERRTALISAAVTGKIDVRNKSLPASL
jgi:type I restriction enzyme S subunit